MAEFTQERSEYGHADAPSDSSTSNAPSASPGPITPSAPVSSTPIPSSPSISNPSPALSARSTQDTISWRATELLRTSNEAEKLAARATALISTPTLRVRTNALLATPEMRAALVAKLGPVSINEVLLHPDSAEHGLTCRLFGLDAALSDSIAAAREESVTLLARDFARDALVGAALGDEEQFEHIATLLANNPIVYEKLVRCAADKYIAWVAASSRVASAARAEQGFNLVSWAASGATSFVRSRLPSNIPTVTVSWPGQAVSTPLSPQSSKVEGGAGGDGSGDGIAEISVEAPDPPPKGNLPADREGIIVEAKLADPSSFGVDQSSPR